MPYEIFLKRSAEKELENLPEKLHDRIVARLLALKENPRPINSKRLRGREGYRIRVGDYRILYIIEEDTKKIEVYSIAHRRDVYR
ncbi:MAG TPA: type II toxin-antitoxin system RelE/ParE family toxin [bacterium]